MKVVFKFLALFAISIFVNIIHAQPCKRLVPTTMMINDGDDMINRLDQPLDLTNPRDVPVRQVLKKQFKNFNDLNIRSTIGGFIKMINIASKNKASGLRVYFTALTKAGGLRWRLNRSISNELNNLSLVWVPTDLYDKGKDICLNKGKRCFYMNNKYPVRQLRRKGVRNWSGYYSQLDDAMISYIGRSKVDPTKEKHPTNSVWYSMKMLDSLAGYLKCLVDSGVLHSDGEMNFRFGVYDDNRVQEFRYYDDSKMQADVSKQMTIFFNIPGLKPIPNKATYLRDFLINMKERLTDPVLIDSCNNLLAGIEDYFLNMKDYTDEKIKKLLNNAVGFIKTNGETNFDTGIPCPPGKNCIEIEP